MGQKVNPKGLRIGINKGWDSNWYAEPHKVPELIKEDHLIRTYLNKTYHNADVSKIEIERVKGKTKDRVRITLYSAKPGMVIGRGGSGVEELRLAIEKMTKKSVVINVEEIKVAELDAQLVAENIASQLERRVTFRRAMKQAIQRTMRFGAQGIKTQVAGRLGGADMARTEGYSEGTIPLQTLRADIDYGFAEAMTTYGKIGVKVWLYKGEVLPTKKVDRSNKKEGAAK